MCPSVWYGWGTNSQEHRQPCRASCYWDCILVCARVGRWSRPSFDWTHQTVLIRQQKSYCVLLTADQSSCRDNKKWHSISNRLFCCVSFIIAMVNRIPRLWNSGWRWLRETWGGPIRNRQCILGLPIRTRLWILGGPIRNRLGILGGSIRKPIINRM